jgi:hypothetical protein
MIIDNHPLRKIKQPNLKHRRQKIPPVPPPDQTQAHDEPATGPEIDLSQHALDGCDDPVDDPFPEDESLWPTDGFQDS